MTIHRLPNTPHIFCPRIAEQHSLAFAVVEYAVRQCSRGQDSVSHEEITVPFRVEDVIRVCSYLPSEEVRKEIGKLLVLGMYEVAK